MYKFHFEIHPATELDPIACLSYLSINLINHTINKSINLTTIVLEKTEQLDWFTKNEAAIKNDKCPIALTDCDSVATGISHFYDRIDPEDSAKLEKLFEYRVSHAIRFAFRGQELPDIYIAANSNGYEVSCVEGESNYMYDVDINSLFKEVDSCKKMLGRLVNQKSTHL